jgi:hypothetical protein
MTRHGQLLCTFSGPIGALLIFAGLWPAMHFLPPLPPTASAAEVAAIFRSNATGILIGSIFIMAGSTFLIAFACGIATQMKRMEGFLSPYAYIQMFTGIFAMVPVFMAAILFSAAAFRPERPDELILLLSDLGFLSLTIAGFPAAAQVIAIGLAVLKDRNKIPVFPRWVGFINLWDGVLFLPTTLVALFKIGPFTWRGALGFWLAAVALGIWVNIMVWALMRARATIPQDSKLR